MKLHEVDIEARDPAELGAIMGEARAARFRATAETAHAGLAGRTIVNVNSTAIGGGVAEMLQTLLAGARGVGIDARWVVIEGNPGFFDVTKRIHNHLYGFAGDGGELGARERAVYEEALAANVEGLLDIVRPGDIVVLHDPQPAGLAAAARDAGATVVWRCHVGVDTPGERSRIAWDFLRPYLADLDGYVFTRRDFAPPWMDPSRTRAIAPSIDPFSSKNRHLSQREVLSVLQHSGVVGGDVGAPLRFTRRDGSSGVVERRADIIQSGPAPEPGTPLVVQISRWDRMKDMAGVLAGFAQHVDGTRDAHLLLAGPGVAGVADDPEAAQVFEDCERRWRALHPSMRSRVHLACLPMHDSDENALIVNALQRHAAVVVQKSLAEGFGLTVVEAMWKARPIVASAIGGIVDQITDGEQGLLIRDPEDLAEFGSATRRLLEDRALAERVAARARERAFADFLPDRHLAQWAHLLMDVAGRREPS